MKTAKSVSLEIDNIINIENLVEKGLYRSFSEFVDRAIENQLQKDYIITIQGGELEDPR